MDPFSAPEKMEKMVSHKVVLPCRYWRCYKSSLLWSNRHRFPVTWKALKICWRRRHRTLGSVWLVTCWRRWRSLTLHHEASAGVCASTLHHVAHVDNHAHHFHWRLRFPDSSAADRFHCFWAITKFTGPTQHQGDLRGLCGTWREYVASVQHAQSR